MGKETPTLIHKPSLHHGGSSGVPLAVYKFLLKLSISRSTLQILTSLDLRGLKKNIPLWLQHPKGDHSPHPLSVWWHADLCQDMKYQNITKLSFHIDSDSNHSLHPISTLAQHIPGMSVDHAPTFETLCISFLHLRIYYQLGLLHHFVSHRCLVVALPTGYSSMSFVDDLSTWWSAGHEFDLVKLLASTEIGRQDVNAAGCPVR